MIAKKISPGVAHKIPADVRKILISNPKALIVWEDITPLARNEWLCWIVDAKKPETRIRRMRIMSENLALGKRRPCCWMGCSHR